MEFIIGTLLWLAWVVTLNVVFKGALKVGFWGAISDAPQLSWCWATSARGHAPTAPSPPGSRQGSTWENR